MIHPDIYVKQTPKGLGVFAGRKFKRGEILWIADDFDVKIPLGEYKSLDRIQRKKIDVYSYMDYNHMVIIPWDEGKYVNHSCSPNSTGVLQYDNISVALRDIDKDEEIVEDYYSYFGHFETFVCKCGAPHCRGMVDKVDSYNPVLRLDLADIAPAILSMPQYLLKVSNKEKDRFMSLLEGLQKKVG